MMSHELRTPLNAIGGYAELLAMGIRGPITEDQQMDLARLRRAQQHLMGLVNDVLNLSRVEGGRVHYDVRPVPILSLIASLEALIAPQAQAKALTYTVGSCDAHVAALADGEKLRQVLLNLLSNAVKYTPAGGRVTVACAADGDQARISGRDTGVGIPPERLDDIFTPFVQLDRGFTSSREGAGLGLAISRDLARGMGGDLTAESRLGIGSVFTVTLPRTTIAAPISG